MRRVRRTRQVLADPARRTNLRLAVASSGTTADSLRWYEDQVQGQRSATLAVGDRECHEIGQHEAGRVRIDNGRVLLRRLRNAVHAEVPLPGDDRTAEHGAQVGEGTDVPVLRRVVLAAAPREAGGRTIAVVPSLSPSASALAAA
jgi:hypothetical protein